MEILGDGASNAFVAVGKHLASGLVVGESLGIHARDCPLLANSVEKLGLKRGVDCV